MIYGLYLSAGGLQSSEYRQNVVANNIANAGTTGFKQQLAVLSERRVEADEDGPTSARHRLLDDLTGGTFVRPTFTDFARGTPATGSSTSRLPARTATRVTGG